MWTYLIVFPSPLLNQDFSFLQSGKDLPVQELISEFSVKGFNIPILPGAAWLYKQCLHPQPAKPSPYYPCRKLRTIV